MLEFSTPEIDSRQPRCPCILVLDTSESMSGERIEKLNAAMPVLAQDLVNDTLAMKRVEVAIVSFPPVRTALDFCNARAFVPPMLIAEGGTPLGEAVLHALRMIEARKEFYRAHHLEWFRPWLFLVTDGDPSPGDDWRGAAAATRDAETRNKISFFAVGVPGADMNVLAEFSRRPPLHLIELRFRDMFQWLSRSLKATSNTNTHTAGNATETVQLSPLDWGRA